MDPCPRFPGFYIFCSVNNEDMTENTWTQLGEIMSLVEESPIFVKPWSNVIQQCGCVELRCIAHILGLSSDLTNI